MKLAYFSPLNPQPSGMSDYSEELLPYLAADAEITLFVDGFAPAILGIELPGLLPVAQLSTAGIGEALERLRHLQPFQKPRLLKACLEAAAADGKFRLAEAELVRAVAATLDCPLPPVIGALDPATLAA